MSWLIFKEMVALLFIVTILGILPFSTSSTVYVTTRPYSGENIAKMFLRWSTIRHDISRYFKSHTKVCFLSGEYKFDRHLTISNVDNISMIGMSAVTFKCNRNVAIFINASKSVRVQNVKFINCGGSFVNTASYIFSAAISLLNVHSIVLSNITFENSLGHGIVGINVLGSSTLVHITVYHNKNLSGTSFRPIGGIKLKYVDTMSQKKTASPHSILIQNCTLCCMSDHEQLHSEKLNKSTPVKFILGFMFYQKYFSVNVQIVNSVITKIVSQVITLVYIMKTFSTKNSICIFINDSRFTHVSSKEIIFTSLTHLQELYGVIQIKNCSFQYNNATLVRLLKSGVRSKVRFIIKHTEVIQNSGVKGMFTASSWDKYESTLIAFENCSFKSNIGLTFNFKNLVNVTFTKTLFFNNTVESLDQPILQCGKTIPIFEQYNLFSSNRANAIISSQRHIGLVEGSTLNISHNRALSENQTLLSMTKSDLNAQPCVIQFFSAKGNLDNDFASTTTTHFSVVFSNNSKYTSFFNGTLLNSCYWLPHSAFNDTTPSDVYKRVIHYDTTTSIIAKRQATLCNCDKTTKAIDCIKDNFTTKPIYPGQTIPIYLIPIPEYQPTVFYPLEDISSVHLPNPVNPCQLISLKSQDSIQLIPNNCTSLAYKIPTTTLEQCSALFSAVGLNTRGSTLYRYYISFKKCPLGFDLKNGTCDCNRHLKVAFPTLTCDIDTEILSAPGNGWIGHTKKDTILFVELCIFCTGKRNKLQLDNPDTQCVGHRTGLQCGQCPTGLSAVFGSFNCKKCSNDMLWLLPVFFIAGILLVFCLFTLNLTVVDGKINGFIAFANLTVVIGYYSFPANGNILFVILSLCNLDLGIETCFYNGMTEYDKTWLQFAFPLYLLCIVGVLAITSRYSSSVERLTRKRVIPVIATIFLLSYSKILLVTTKVLFSYTTVHKIGGFGKTLIWMWDTNVSVFETKFILLFIICLIVFLTVLLPLNFLLIFTKFIYKCKLISKYLKPYLDAYQAPFKIQHHYYFGIELLIRPILFAISNRMIFIYKTLTFYIITCAITTVYVCAFKPFRSTATLILYISYVFNLGCQLMVVLYYTPDIHSISYGILFNALNTIALVEFGCTVFHYLYVSHLYKIVTVSTLKSKVSGRMMKFLRRFRTKSEDTTFPMRPVRSYEELREELLIINPNK